MSLVSLGCQLVVQLDTKVVFQILFSALFWGVLNNADLHEKELHIFIYISKK